MGGDLYLSMRSDGEIRGSCLLTFGISFKRDVNFFSSMVRSKLHENVQSICLMY